MPKTKQPRTEADELRWHAQRASGARWEEALNAVTILEERKDAAEETATALEDLESIHDQLETIAGALTSLRDYNMASDDAVEALNQAVSLLDDASGEVSKDDLTSFVEAYDAATEVLDTYQETKEQDPYPGKREEVESAWAEVTEALGTLADALDTVEFNATVTTTEETEES